MAGHSKWANIQHRKGRQDEKRGKIWTRIIREITVAAKLGLPDPKMNARLRLAIQNARAENMPKDKLQVGFMGENCAVACQVKYADGDIHSELTQWDSVAKSGSKGQNLFERITVYKPSGQGSKLLLKVSSSGLSQMVSAYLVIPEQNTHVELSSGKQISESIQTQEVRFYTVTTEKAVVTGTIQFEASQGSIIVKISDMYDPSQDPEALVLSLEASGESKQKEITLTKGKDSKGDIGLFKTAYVQVIGSANSVFTIKVPRSSQDFEAIIPGQKTTLTYESGKKSIYYYRVASTSEVKSLKLVFTLDNGRSVKDGVMVYFIRSMEELISRTNFYYASEEEFGRKDQNIGHGLDTRSQGPGLVERDAVDGRGPLLLEAPREVRRDERLRRRGAARPEPARRQPPGRPFADPGLSPPVRRKPYGTTSPPGLLPVSYWQNSCRAGRGAPPTGGEKKGLAANGPLLSRPRKRPPGPRAEPAGAPFTAARHGRGGRGRGGP